MRVTLADDSALFRHGLTRLLDDLDVQVVAAYCTGDELLASIARDLPDAVILDIRMPPTHTTEGLDTAARIRDQHPDVGVLVLSTYAESSYATKLLSAGASHVGYLLKDHVDEPATLLDALHRTADGGSVVDPNVVAQLLAGQRHAAELAQLTDRERSVLELMAQGRSNNGIGQVLFLSPKTVENHIAAIFTKLGLACTHDTNRRVLAVLTWLNAAGH